MANQNQNDGWAVSVLTEQLSGGPPMICLYVAAVPDQVEAIKLVTLKFAGSPGNNVGQAYPIKQSTIAALGYNDGDCWML